MLQGRQEIKVHKEGHPGRWNPVVEGRSLLILSIHTTGCKSIDTFLRVILKASGLLLLLRLPWPLFQLLWLQSEYVTSIQ